MNTDGQRFARTDIIALHALSAGMTAYRHAPEGALGGAGEGNLGRLRGACQHQRDVDTSIIAAAKVELCITSLVTCATRLASGLFLALDVDSAAD